MHSKRFQVIFTGKYTPGATRDTVVSNLVLFGVPESKARALVQRPRAVLKRFNMAVDAQRMVTKLERAGLACVVEEYRPGSAADQSGGAQGESMLVSLFSRFAPARVK